MTLKYIHLARRIWTTDLRISDLSYQLQSSALPAELSRVAWLFGGKISMHFTVFIPFAISSCFAVQSVHTPKNGHIHVNSKYMKHLKAYGRCLKSKLSKMLYLSHIQSYVGWHGIFRYWWHVFGWQFEMKLQCLKSIHVSGGTRTHSLRIRSPARYPLRHGDC